MTANLTGLADGRVAKIMTEKAMESKSKKVATATPGGKILTGSIYILTILFVLGYIWQSLAAFL